MKTTNNSTPTKSIKRFTLIGTALSALVITVLASFAVSGTLAKFIDTVGAQSGAVPAAQFNFNEVYDVESNTFTPIVWNLDQLGATINPSYSSKIFYPGAYGDFSLDVSLISDVPVIADATIDFIHETGAFVPEVVYGEEPDVAPLRDLISLRFVLITKNKGEVPAPEEIDFVNDGLKLSELELAFKTELENSIGANGEYRTLGLLVEKTVYVYWNWDFEVSAAVNEMDTLFGNYVAKFRDDGIESTLGLSVTLVVTQDTLDGTGAVVVTPDAPTIPQGETIVTANSIIAPVISGAEYSLDGTTWQDSNEFTGLNNAQEYTVHIRIKADGATPYSASSTVAVVTLPATPSAPMQSGIATTNSITLVAVDGLEYGYSLTNTEPSVWQDSNVLTGLEPGAEHYLFVRVKATGNIPASAVSTALSVSTDIEIWNGTGTAVPATATIDGKSYYLIYNAGELAWFRDKTNDLSNGQNLYINGKLMANIYLNDTTDWESWSASTTGLNSWTPIGNHGYCYKGTFDGNNRAVRGIYINTSADWQGLFGHVEANQIKNLGVEESFIKAGSIVGGIAGGVYNTTFINCHNTGTIVATGDAVGGIVSAGSSTLINCYNTGSISGVGNVGGLNGANAVLIRDCYNTGTISATGAPAGGISGGFTGSLYNSYNSGSVSGTSGVGGAIGDLNGGSVYNCYNTGSAVGSGIEIGGLVGQAQTGMGRVYIGNCYNIGTVSGSARLGGVVGYVYNVNSVTTITSCYHLNTLGLGTYGGSYVGASYTPPTVSNCKTFTSALALTSSVTIDGVAYTDITQALNAYVTLNSTNGYKSWQVSAGTNNGYPIFIN